MFLFLDMTFTNVGNKTQFDDLVNFEKMVSSYFCCCYCFFFSFLFQSVDVGLNVSHYSCCQINKRFHVTCVCSVIHHLRRKIR